MKIVFFANTDWYLFNFRRSLALYVQSLGYDVIMVSPPGCYVSEIQSLGLRWVCAPMVRKSLNPIREIKVIYWLNNFIRNESIDLVHGFTIKCAIYAAIAVKISSLRVKNVSAIAGLGYVFSSNKLKARLLRPFLRYLMRLSLGGKCSRVILQNPDDVELFCREKLVRKSIIRLIPGSGINSSLYKSKPYFDSQKKLRVLLAARLLWDKGILEYINAARDLLSDGRSLVFLLAGTSDEGNPASIPTLKVLSWVEEGIIDWLGHVDDMPSLLATVDISVLPSYREGLPRFLLESAAASLPIVTTDVPGCRSVVSHDIDGLLVEPRNFKSLASAIARLQDNPDFALKLGVAAREKVHSLFDERIVLRKTVDVYRELLFQS